MRYAYELTLPCSDRIVAARELKRLRELPGFLAGRILPGIPATVRAFFEPAEETAGKRMIRHHLPTGVRKVALPLVMEKALFEAK